MEPRPVKYPLGSLSLIEAKSFGEPGERTFVLALEAGPAAGSLWLEKEQLFQLGVYLRDVVQSMSDEDRERASQPVEAEKSGEGASVEFKVGQLLLSYDPAANSFCLTAYEREEADPTEEATSVSFWITPEQADNLAKEALRICAAGRPRCFLCGLPIDPEGHICPRANGHTTFEVG
tara:strand:- start:1266 stop:1796 length:531 start_codon:yes stop_codon:yes gene_type:complete